MFTTIANTLPYVWALVKSILCGVVILAAPVLLGYLVLRCWEKMKEKR